MTQLVCDIMKAHDLVNYSQDLYYLVLLYGPQNYNTIVEINISNCFQASLADGLTVPTVGVNAFATGAPIIDKVLQF